MFTESILENSWAQRTRRGWTTLTSFGVQAIVIGVLLTIPLLRTIGVPLARTVSTPITLGRHDPGPSPQTHAGPSRGMQIIPYHGPIMAPGRIPNIVDRMPDKGFRYSGGDAPTIDFGPSNGPGLPGFETLPTGTRPVMPVHPVAAKPVFRTSSMLQGALIRRVEPSYPPLARAARIQGPVELAAVISKAGVIENLQVISGHPMLIGAAIEAVKQWRYKPYILNGDAIEVETRITVNFVLQN